MLPWILRVLVPTADVLHFFRVRRGALPLLLLSLFVFPAKADDAFSRWVQGLWPSAEKAGISRSVFDAAFKDVTPDPAVLEAAGNQAEFVKAIWDYLDVAASDWRVDKGKEASQTVLSELSEIEKKWGVDPATLTAIWGLESSYGRILDNPKIVKSVVRSLATLAYQDPRRSQFGRTQLIAALKILESGDTTPGAMTGSWAGAMGHTQFIPTTYLAHAVDFDGDGKRDIWSSAPDALASAANYLAVSGWETGKSWGYEVILPDGFDFALADGRLTKPISKWKALGIVRAVGFDFPDGTDDARLFLPAGARGPAFLLLKNFDVIKRYNNANAYALAIGHISDRLRGQGAFVGSWPRDLTPLTVSERKDLQRLLTQSGFDTGGVDGLIGPKSRAAIRAFQNSVGLVPDGYETSDLLSRLRR